MFAQLFHQFGSLQAFVTAGPVVDLGRGHQLTALLEARDEQGFEIRPRRINGSTVAGWSGTEDHEPGMSGVCHAGQFRRSRAPAAKLLQFRSLHRTPVLL